MWQWVQWEVEWAASSSTLQNTTQCSTVHTQHACVPELVGLLLCTLPTTILMQTENWHWKVIQVLSWAPVTSRWAFVLILRIIIRSSQFQMCVTDCTVLCNCRTCIRTFNSPNCQPSHHICLATCCNRLWNHHIQSLTPFSVGVTCKIPPMYMCRGLLLVKTCYGTCHKTCYVCVCENSILAYKHELWAASHAYTAHSRHMSLSPFYCL